MSATTTRRSCRDRGAAAVELAIVLPLVLLLVAGIIDFGRAYYVNIMYTNAARDGVRMMALGLPNTDVTARVTDAASTGLAGTPTITLTDCHVDSSGLTTASVEVKSPSTFKWLFVDSMARFFGGSMTPLSVSSTATMRCES